MSWAKRAVVFLGILLLPIVVNAYDHVATGKITYIENGWFGESLVIHQTSGIDGCGRPNNEFAIDKEHPAFDVLVSLALAAYTSQSNVQLVVKKGICKHADRTDVVSIMLVR